MYNTVKVPNTPEPGPLKGLTVNSVLCEFYLNLKASPTLPPGGVRVLEWRLLLTQGPNTAPPAPSLTARSPKTHSVLPEPRVLCEALHAGPGMVVPWLQLYGDFQGQAHWLLVLFVTQACDRKGS